MKYLVSTLVLMLTFSIALAQMPVVYKATFTASSAAKEIKTYYLKSAAVDHQNNQLVFQNVVWIKSVYWNDTIDYHYYTEYVLSKSDTLIMYNGESVPLDTYFDRYYKDGLYDLLKVNKYIILKFPHLKTPIK